MLVQREHLARWIVRIRGSEKRAAGGTEDPDRATAAVLRVLAARVTRGLAMPNTCDPARDPAGVVFVTAEDGLADTIRPRLDAAEGDPERVLVFPLDTLPQIDEAGLQTIENAIHACGARFLVWDPLNAFLSERVDTYKDHHIRRALAPLAALAARTGAAVLVIRHLNKSGGQNAKYRGGGSIGIFGAARSALLAAPDPNDPSRKVLAVNKHNLYGEVPALAYEMVEVHKPIPTVQVRWLGPTTHTARDLLVDAESDDDRSALDEAIAWLRDQLTSGPQLAEEMFKAAAKVRIAERTLQRARAKVATSKKDDFKAGWVWELKPGQGAKAPSIFCHPGAFAWFSAFSDPSGSEGAKPEGARSTSPLNLGALEDVGAFDDSKDLADARGPDFAEGAKNAEGAKMPKGDGDASTPGLRRAAAGVTS